MIKEIKNKKLSMVGSDRLQHIINACEYVTTNDIPGVWVELGVWRGGCSILAAKNLDREIWMYDTFNGMTEPGDEDWKPNKDRDYARRNYENNPDWCYSSIEEVQKNLDDYNVEAKLIKGDACETVVHTKPDQISILRLDMDFYEPTKAALEHLYPLLSEGGVLLVDDYYSWNGARKAVDEYLGVEDYGHVGYKRTNEKLNFTNLYEG